MSDSVNRYRDDWSLFTASEALHMHATGAVSLSPVTVADLKSWLEWRLANWTKSTSREAYDDMVKGVVVQALKDLEDPIAACCGCCCGRCRHQGGDGNHTQACVDFVAKGLSESEFESIEWARDFVHSMSHRGGETPFYSYADSFMHVANKLLSARKP